MDCAGLNQQSGREVGCGFGSSKAPPIPSIDDIDEISDMPYAMQTSPLRVLQDGQIRPVAPLITGALEILMQFDWPGNVRELKNQIERTLTLAGGGLC